MTEKDTERTFTTGLAFGAVCVLMVLVAAMAAISLVLVIQLKGEMKRERQAVIMPATAQAAAFSVQYSKAIMADPVRYTPIPFDIILRNDQDVYNQTTAEFTAPTKGVYSFHFSAASATGYMLIFLHSSQKGNLATAAAGTINTQASNSVIIELDAGTRITVQLNPKQAAQACGPPCSTFSGHLIYATLV